VWRSGPIDSFTLRGWTRPSSNSCAGVTTEAGADLAAITSALDGLGRTPVYLHLEVDVIDSAQLPGLRFPSGPGPFLTQIEECLAAPCATTDMRAAGTACAWLPDRVSDQTTREAITRLARALGTDLAWHEPAAR
jgi:arginase